jgi:hypothetical protein
MELNKENWLKERSLIIDKGSTNGFLEKFLESENRPYRNFITLMKMPSIVLEQFDLDKNKMMEKMIEYIDKKFNVTLLYKAEDGKEIKVW